MPKSNSPVPRDRRIAVRMTQGQYDTLEDMANQSRTSVSELVRSAVDGLVNAAGALGPAYGTVLEGTPPEQLAALAVVRSQLDGFITTAQLELARVEALEAQIRGAGSASEQAAS